MRGSLALALALALIAIQPAYAETAEGSNAVMQEAEAQDPYQWLETPTDARALDWARKQTQEAKAKIAAMPEHARISAELKSALAASDSAPNFMLAGPYALKLQRSVAHPHGVLSVSRRGPDGTPGAWRDVLDVDALNAAEGKSYELRFGAMSLDCDPVAYNRCILQLSPAGADDVELREFDLASGQFVPDGFRTPASRAFAVWLDSNTLLLQHTAEGAATLPSGWARAVYLWKRGTPLSSAKIVYTAEPTDSLMLLAATGKGADRVGIIMKAIDYSTFEYFSVRLDGSTQALPLPRNLKMGYPVANGGRVFAQLGKEATVQGKVAPAESIVAYDFNPSVAPDKRLSVAYRPEKDEFVTDAFMGMAPTRSGLKIVLNKRGVQQLTDLKAGTDGWVVARGKPEPIGTNIGFDTVDPAGDAVVLKRAGYLVPNRVELVSAGKTTTLFSEKAAFAADKFVVDLKSATSRDGTQVDYYLLRPKAAAKSTPMLMTGYGAFGISTTPEYLDHGVGGKSLVIWLNRGGALAVPLIRGGGERGEAWHLAAIREKRENSYDDFAAVTEAIIASGFTTPDRIGVFGMSNGGLLSAVMGTRRPDLYGAIVSDVPLTDLVRLSYMGMGAAWTNEYGDAKDPEMLAAITHYSPYQNVVKGKKYPPFMLSVATSDNRVGPGHARKLAAKLEEAGAAVYYLEDQEGGHGVSDPLSRPDLMADRMTFLVHTLMSAN